MRRKSAPVRNGADDVIAAGREKPSGSSIELNGTTKLPLSDFPIKVLMNSHDIGAF